MKKFWNKNKYIIVTILWFTLMFLIATNLPAQTVGTTKTESYKASFETKINIDSLMDYDGPQVPIQILTIGISDEVYEQYPELKEKKVGLGVANIVLEYLSDLNRFTFTEDKTEIKNRMVKQFQASQSGITEDKLDGRGKIRLAHYFVTVELKDGVKNTVNTRLGLQVRFTDAETGEIVAASGLGEAKTVRELTLLNDDNLSDVKFNQSTIGITTKKALDIACGRILVRLIKKGKFPR
jgi:predicted CopG family antitoxin